MELLVVIGIVAALAALLFPVFSRVREKSRQTVCLSNERQLGMVLLLYAQGSDEYFPMGRDAWAGELYPYVKAVEVFHCPSDGTGAQPPYYPVSYGINSNLWYTVPYKRGLKEVPHALADVSAKTILFFEVSHSTAQVTTIYEGWGVTTVPLSESVSGEWRGVIRKWHYFQRHQI